MIVSGIGKDPAVLLPLVDDDYVRGSLLVFHQFEMMFLIFT